MPKKNRRRQHELLGFLAAWAVDYQSLYNLNGLHPDHPRLQGAQQVTDPTKEEVELQPGWLKRDVDRAVAQVAEWEGTSPSPTQIVTDDMCRRAVDAARSDRIQGFSTPHDSPNGLNRTWGAPHYVRDVWLSRDKQELWRGNDHDEMMDRIRIEEMRLALRAALASPQPDAGGQAMKRFFLWLGLTVLVSAVSRDHKKPDAGRKG